jgi:hypothetical protein
MTSSREVQKLSYEQAVEDLLAPWHNGENLAAGQRVSSPKEAAVRGLVAAINTNDEKGTVRVLVQNVEQKRLVRSYWEAFFADEPRLRPLLRKVMPDSIKLNGGVELIVDQNEARLAKNLIAQIVLDPSVNDAIGAIWWDSEDETWEEAAIRAGYTADQEPQLLIVRWLRDDEVKANPELVAAPSNLTGPPADAAPHGDPDAQQGASPASPHAAYDHKDIDPLQERLDKAAREREAQKKYDEAIEARKREEVNARVRAGLKRISDGFA